MMIEISNAKRIVLKIGSALLTDINDGHLNADWLHHLLKSLTAYEDKQWIIVTSGAVALGRPSLDISSLKKTSDLTLEQKQAAASIGQVRLSQAFDNVFQNLGRSTGQILLSLRDTEDRRSHLNARATIQTLLDFDVTPVINENDTVATQEIRFGDNDRLAARVSQMMSADLLILLSTTDGLYDSDPNENPNAKHFDVIEELTPELMSYAKETTSGISMGGMISKIQAAKIASDGGGAVIIADGRKNDPLNQAEKYTFIKPQQSSDNARKGWIRAHLVSKGEITIDNGAIKALENGKSLLPVGVKKIIGEFQRGDAVLIKDVDNRLIARGLIAYDSFHAEKIAGCKTSSIADIIGFEGRPELVHRDDLVLEDYKS